MITKYDFNAPRTRNSLITTLTAKYPNKSLPAADLETLFHLHQEAFGYIYVIDDYGHVSRCSWDDISTMCNIIDNMDPSAPDMDTDIDFPRTYDYLFTKLREHFSPSELAKMSVNEMSELYNDIYMYSIAYINFYGYRKVKPIKEE